MMPGTGEIVFDEPPKLERCDRRVRKAKGTSFALDMRPEKLQRTKNSAHVSHEERYMHQVRTNGAYRREIVFFRKCFEKSKQLVRDVSDVAQRLTLHQYYYGGLSEDGDNEIDELSTQIREIVQGYQAVIKLAENDWVEMTQQEAVCVRADQL
jgi:hypothetical protein